MTLKKAATSGLLWTFIDTAVSRGIGLVASIILARLLFPEDFGLMGMIYIITSIAATLVDSGLTASLIRTKFIKSIDYSTIFYTNIFVSILLYGIVYATAPLIADFYQEFVLVNILRVYGLIFVINAFSAVQIARFTKKMQFKKLMIYNIPGVLIGSIAGVFMAYNGYGVWSIVCMQLLTQSVLALTLWIMSDWKPKKEFSTIKLKTHYNFGYKLMFSGLLNAGFNNIYNVLIGKFFSTGMLGQFERAKSYNDYPVTILTTMIGKVSYPLLANIQDEKERLILVYKRILKFAFFVSAPLMLTLSAVGKPLFLFVLGEKWETAATFFQILCFAGLLYPIHAFNLNLLKVLGRSDLFLKLEILKKCIIVIFVAMTFHYGIYGLVWSMLLSSVGALFVNTYYTNKLIGYSVWNQFSDLKLSALLSALMFIMMWFVLSRLDGFSLLFQIVIPAITGLSFYVVTNSVFKNDSFQLLLELKKNLK